MVCRVLITEASPRVEPGLPERRLRSLRIPGSRVWAQELLPRIFLDQ